MNGLIKTKDKNNLSMSKVKNAEVKINQTQRECDKENLDVEKLEGFSLSKIISMVKGDLEDRLNKEKEEALEALKKYEHAKQNLEYFRLKLESLNKEILSFGNIEE